jgi:hypothetical protein
MPTMDTAYTFAFHQWTAGGADYTLLHMSSSNTFGCSTGTVSVPTTADTIAEIK